MLRYNNSMNNITCIPPPPKRKRKNKTKTKTKLDSFWSPKKWKGFSTLSIIIIKRNICKTKSFKI